MDQKQNAVDQTRPNVFEYSDFRGFIIDFVEYKRALGEFSNRKFAKEAGFGSHSYLPGIISGRRGLPREKARGVAKGLNLDDLEAKFFVALSAYNQTTDSEVKSDLRAKLLFLKARTGEKTKYQAFSMNLKIPSEHYPALVDKMRQFKLELARLSQEAGEDYKISFQISPIDFDA